MAFLQVNFPGYDFPIFQKSIFPILSNSIAKHGGKVFPHLSAMFLLGSGYLVAVLDLPVGNKKVIQAVCIKFHHFSFFI